MQYFESNKKSTKFFFDHCKYNFKKKTIKQLLINDKITNDDEILEEPKYYERLYREKHTASNFYLLEVESYKLHILKKSIVTETLVYNQYN